MWFFFSFFYLFRLPCGIQTSWARDWTWCCRDSADPIAPPQAGTPIDVIFKWRLPMTWQGSWGYPFDPRGQWEARGELLQWSQPRLSYMIEQRVKHVCKFSGDQKNCWANARWEQNCLDEHSNTWARNPNYFYATEFLWLFCGITATDNLYRLILNIANFLIKSVAA